MKNTFFIVTLFFITTLGCKTKIESDHNFVYTIDKDGVYLYSFKNNNSNKIYQTDNFLINEYFKQINDSIVQVGYQNKMISIKKKRKVFSKYLYKADGDSTFITDNPPYETEDNYDFLTDSIFNINIKTSKSYLASIVDYEHYEFSLLKIKTRTLNNKGELISTKDTTYTCSGTSSTSSGIKFCDFKRFYSESEVNFSRQIITERGNLILKEGTQKSTLLEFQGQFDPKFGSGYYNPILTTDGKKTTFQYLAGFLNSGSCLYEMDIETKSKIKLIGEGYFNPIYSPNDKLLLLFSNNKKSKSNTWINDIYLFNIATKTKAKIAKGNNYIWLK
jgi:hypothetical protein